jgi:hypothetical protein
MKRPMDLTIQNSEFFNPGQVSILGADQPVYALIKLFQGNSTQLWAKTSWWLYMLIYVN